MHPPYDSVYERGMLWNLVHIQIFKKIQRDFQGEIKSFHGNRCMSIWTEYPPYVTKILQVTPYLKENYKVIVGINSIIASAVSIIAAVLSFL